MIRTLYRPRDLQGFGTFERKGSWSAPSERVSVGSVALAVGSMSDTVSVEATGTHVNTEETQHGGVITRTQIQQIQVLGRDVTSLMRVLPGVRYTTPVDSMGGTFGVDVPRSAACRPTGTRSSSTASSPTKSATAACRPR